MDYRGEYPGDNNSSEGSSNVAVCPPFSKTGDSNIAVCPPGPDGPNPNIALRPPLLHPN